MVVEGSWVVNSHFSNTCCVGQCSKCFPHYNLIHIQHPPCPFYGWGNECTERSSNLPRVVQHPRNSRQWYNPALWVQSPWFQPSSYRGSQMVLNPSSISYWLWGLEQILPYSSLSFPSGQWGVDASLIALSQGWKERTRESRWLFLGYKQTKIPFPPLTVNTMPWGKRIRAAELSPEKTQKTTSIP